jgi:hypothetical protein
MNLVNECVKNLMEKCSDLNISENDMIIIIGGNLYKEIPGHVGYYISIEGDIIGPRGNFIKLDEHYTGYYKAHLRDKKCFVHRLVMLTFRPIPGCEDLVVNHKDLNKKNNHIDNLEWTTHRENSWHYQKFSMREKITEEIKDRIMQLPKDFTREDLDRVLEDI